MQPSSSPPRRYLNAAGLAPDPAPAAASDGGDHASGGRQLRADEGLGLLEAAAVDGGEPCSRHARSIDPVLAAFAHGAQLGLGEDRAKLRAFIRPLQETAGSAALSLRRSRMALDWLVRENLAAWLALSADTAPMASAVQALAPLHSSAAVARAAHALAPICHKLRGLTGEEPADGAPGRWAEQARLTSLVQAAWLAVAGSRTWYGGVVADVEVAYGAGVMVWLRAASLARAQAGDRPALQATAQRLQESGLQRLGAMIDTGEDLWHSHPASAWPGGSGPSR